MNVPYDALFQNCINGYAPPNRRATRAPDKKSFKQPPDPLAQIQNNFTEICMGVLVTCKNEEDPFKNEGTRVVTTDLQL